MNFRFFVFILTLFSLSIGQASEPSESVPQVQAVKAFVKALRERDETEIRRYSLPNSELPSLWANALSHTDKASLTRILNDDLRVLKAGDSIPMEDGDLIVPPEFATERLVLVHGPSMLYPFPVHLVGDDWKVNPGPLLAARKKAGK